jgi:hypothetical protein
MPQRGNGPRARGERHYRARLTDAEVELMRSVYESGGIGYRKLAQKFECGQSTVRDIVKYRTR